MSASHNVVGRWRWRGRGRRRTGGHRQGKRSSLRRQRGLAGCLRRRRLRRRSPVLSEAPVEEPQLRVQRGLRALPQGRHPGTLGAGKSQGVQRLPRKEQQVARSLCAQACMVVPLDAEHLRDAEALAGPEHAHLDTLVGELHLPTVHNEHRISGLPLSDDLNVLEAEAPVEEHADLGEEVSRQASEKAQANDLPVHGALEAVVHQPLESVALLREALERVEQILARHGAHLAKLHRLHLHVPTTTLLNAKHLQLTKYHLLGYGANNDAIDDLVAVPTKQDVQLHLFVHHQVSSAI
mmetsp:Transcript_78950/g.231741  ORF Transcript_78950/g.231741 Transcript_78950/m.231741 type:complete len:295 (-) Transcript_78950:2069-2953(-)